MTDTASPSPAPPLPPAIHQTSLAPDRVLHSTSAGVIVERVGQLRNGLRSEGRTFARELAEYINTAQAGVATVFVYEETFGTKDRIHWLIHMRSLEDYETLVQMGTTDEGFRDLFVRNQVPAERGGGSWDRMFLDGSLSEMVMIPQQWRMYGTVAAGEAPATPAAAGGWASATAQHQTTLAPEDTLNSATAGIVIHRSAQLQYAWRSEGRQFAREVVESINARQQGVASAFLYEEAFGPADRIHWLIHMKSLSAYYALIEMHVRDEAVRELYFRERIPPEKGGGGWSRMFVEGSILDTALTPQHWGMYATRR